MRKIHSDGVVDRSGALLAAAYPDLDLKDHHEAELSAGKELLKPLYARAGAILAVLTAPLRWLVKRFAGNVIGHLADAAWKLITSLFQ